MKKVLILVLPLLVLVVGLARESRAQTTAFNYQGSLKNNGVDANGSYDFEFALYDAATGGTQLGSTNTRSPVTVTNGVFAVSLDFGSQFPGAARFLEVRVRQTGGGAFTPLTPRQPMTATPYAIRSLNAASADSVVVGGVPSGSGNYIQNQNAAPQATSNFNISGNGIAGGSLSGNIVNAISQYNLAGGRILSNSGTNNLFAGINAGTVNAAGVANAFYGASAGAANTSGNFNAFFGAHAGEFTSTGSYNAFFGDAAGFNNSTGNENSFFGYQAGQSSTGSSNSFFGFQAGTSNSVGIRNSFFGWNAGNANTDGAANSFFGALAGTNNISGAGNSFFGRGAGQANTNGSANSFFGQDAGSNNTVGETNAFFGWAAGAGNTTGGGNTFVGNTTGNTNSIGSENTAIGDSAGMLSNNLTNATALGSKAAVSQSNSLVLGSINGTNSATADTNVGIGTTAPGYRLSVTGSVGSGPSQGVAEFASNSLDTGVRIRNFATNGRTWGLFSSGGATGLCQGCFSIYDTNAGQARITIDTSGNVSIPTLGAAGAIALCRNASNQLSTCSSSLRYKINVGVFGPGLGLVTRLRPIRFDWKDGGMHDLGLAAEDVAAIEPLLVTYNKEGQVEGVKYDRISVVLVNAVKEQQKQIESQQMQIERQQTENERQRTEIGELKKLVCELKPSAKICIQK